MHYESKKFIGSLIYLTRDYPELRKDIQKLRKPTPKSLVRIATSYHENICEEGEPCIVYEKSFKREIKMIISGGSRTFFNLNNEFSDDKVNLDQLHPGFAMHILFQEILLDERLFVGIGLVTDGQILSSGNTTIRIPLSLNYYHPRPGFSPAFNYQLDINRVLLTQAVGAGLRYNWKTFSATLIPQLYTWKFFEPYGVSLSLDLTFSLNSFD